MVEPDALAEAAKPASGRQAGLARLLVQGDLRGSSHLMALTDRGRVLGSVAGSEGAAVSACPGGRFAVQSGERLHVIRLRDLRVVRSTNLPGDDSVDVRCLDRAGRDAVALTYEFNKHDRPDKPLRLVRVRAGRARTVTRAPGWWHSLGTRALAVANRGRVQTYAYQSGRRRIALRLPGITGVTWSPDGRVLAALASGAEKSKLALKRSDGVVVRRPLTLAGPAFDSPTWIGPRRLAVIEIRRDLGHLFDRRLRGAGRIRDWDLPGTVGRGAVWTIDTGTLRRLALDGSGCSHDRRRDRRGTRCHRHPRRRTHRTRTGHRRDHQHEM